MIKSELLQTRAHFGKKYELNLDGGKLIGETTIPITLTPQIKVVINGQKFNLKFSILEDTINKYNLSSNAKLLPFQLYDMNDMLIGYLCICRTKYLFGYSFFELKYKDEIYRFYSIGMGKAGLKIPMYTDQDNQVGLIEKNTVTYDNKSTYTIHTFSEHEQMLAFLFSVYYDNAFYSTNEIARLKKQTTYQYTLNKTLKNKYDPNFIKKR